MRIKKLHVKNFKSLVDFELEDLKSFCAFVGPNASGKSNIFEALEFTNYLIKYGPATPGLFGGIQDIYSFLPIAIPGAFPNPVFASYKFDDKILIDYTATANIQNPNNFTVMMTRVIDENNLEHLSMLDIRDLNKRASFVNNWIKSGNRYDQDYEQFADSFSRIFINKSTLNRTPPTNNKLAPDAVNLSQIIGLIFEDKDRRRGFIEWLRILIPEFKDIEVRKSNIDGNFEFFVFENGSSKPFSPKLISDGTYNILALMAAVYQATQPQFLCIEEPENGLHPQAIKLLVDFFREKCEEEGHHIWLNTHSQTLVRCLEIDEIILVNKIDGATKAKQLRKEDEVNIKTDEAWLSNALGGGVIWSK